MTKALAAAIEKRESMTRTGASAESIEVMDRRIARLQPKPKGEGKDQGKAQETETVNSFDAALSTFTAAAHRHLCTRCLHTAMVLDAAGIEYEIAS